MSHKLFSFDTESTGLMHHLGDRMFSYSWADRNLRSKVYRVDGKKPDRIRNRKRLHGFLLGEDNRIVMHHAKHDLTACDYELEQVLEEGDVDLEDTMIEMKLLRSDLPTFALKPLTHLLCGYPMEDEKAVKSAARGVGYQRVPENIMQRYQVGDVERTMLLHLFAQRKWRDATPEMRKLYETEKRLIWATKKMEYRGIRISPQKTGELIRGLEKGMERSLAKLEKMAGRYVNPVGKQAANFLFNDLGMPVMAKTEKTGSPRAKKEDLLALRETNPHPALDEILKYRSWQRGRTTLQSYLDLSRDGLLHPTINTYGAETGRESISNPNAHNVEKSGGVGNPFPVPARKVFICKVGYVNFYIDYRGIELRIIAHFAGDEKLTQMFRDGVNPHDYMADFWYGDRYRKAKSPKVKQTLYDAAKNTNYAIPYGANALKVAQILQLPFDSVQSKWAEYEDTFPGFVSLQRRTRRQVKEQGYVTTLRGRRIYVQRDKPYVGVNYRIQGSGADILKEAQVRVDDLLSQRTGNAAGIILPVHDEIGGEYPRERGMRKLWPLLQDVCRLMVDFPEMSIPLEVECKLTSTSWEEAEKIDLEQLVA